MFRNGRHQGVSIQISKLFKITRAQVAASGLGTWIIIMTVNNNLQHMQVFNKIAETYWELKKLLQRYAGTGKHLNNLFLLQVFCMCF